MKLFSDGPRYALRIAVNRAIYPHLSGCYAEWWSVHDALSFAVYDPGFYPRVFTTQSMVDHPHLRKGVGGVERFANSETFWVEDESIKPDRKEYSWSMYSATSAIALAGHLGAKRIDVYGADMSGTQDADGHTDKRFCRTDVRWQNEREVLDKLTQWLGVNGVTVRRVLNGTH